MKKWLLKRSRRKGFIISIDKGRERYNPGGRGVANGNHYMNWQWAQIDEIAKECREDKEVMIF